MGSLPPVNPPFSRKDEGNQDKAQTYTPHGNLYDTFACCRLFRLRCLNADLIAAHLIANLNPWWSFYLAFRGFELVRG